VGAAVFVAQGHVGAARKRAAEGQDAHEALRQRFEQVVIDQRADLDAEPRLLPHLARQRGAMIFARFRPPARQVPFVALVHQQQHATLVDQYGFDRKGMGPHGQ